MATIRQLIAEARNPVQEGEYMARMAELYTVREPLESLGDAAQAARRARRRFGAITRVFERCGFWRVQGAA